MLKRLLLAFSVVSVIGLSMTAIAHARETTIVGVKTRVEPDRIEVMSDRHEAATVSLTPYTSYLKWITAKPWQQDIRSSARALRPGRRVHIDVGLGASPIAQTVWIVTGRPGLD